MTTFGFLCGFAAEARLLGQFRYVVHGDGGVAGAREAISSLPLGDIGALVSFGVAGGLDPALKPGALIIPDEVLATSQAYATDFDRVALLRRALPAAIGGRMIAGDRLVDSVSDKAALWASSGGLAVDLESGVAAEAAAAFGLPLLVVRAVADPAHKALPSAAQIPMTAAGRPNLPAILADVARSPGQIPRLIALAQETGRALASLRVAAAALSRI